MRKSSDSLQLGAQPLLAMGSAVPLARGRRWRGFDGCLDCRERDGTRATRRPGRGPHLEQDLDAGASGYYIEAIVANMAQALPRG
jgi:hypothetical protein